MCRRGIASERCRPGGTIPLPATLWRCRPPPHVAVLEERQERLAVTALVQGAGAPGFFRGEGIPAIGALDIGEEVEEALGAKEKAIRRLGQPGEIKRGGEAALVALAAIEIVPA